MQLKVENSVNICVVDEVKRVDEARSKNWPCFFFFTLLYIKFTFFLKKLQHQIAVIIPSGKMKEGSIWNHVRSNETKVSCGIKS